MHIHLSDLFDAVYWRSLGHSTVETIWDVVKIVVAYLLVRAALRKVIHRIVVPVILKSAETDTEHAARLRTLASLINSICGYVLTFVFAVMLLQAFGLNPVPLLTTASVAGVAVAFGAQKLFKDVISGFFIVLENQYAVGEYVTIGTVTGVVEEVGMRTTRIRDDAGRLYMLSNGDVTLVCNQSRGAVLSFIEIGVVPDTDIARATGIIEEAGKSLTKERPDLGFKRPPSVMGIAAVEAAKVTLRVTCATENPGHLTDAQIALRSLIHRRLTAEGITIA